MAEHKFIRLDQSAAKALIMLIITYSENYNDEWCQNILDQIRDFDDNFIGGILVTDYDIERLKEVYLKYKNSPVCNDVQDSVEAQVSDDGGKTWECETSQLR